MQNTLRTCWARSLSLCPHLPLVAFSMNEDRILEFLEVRAEWMLLCLMTGEHLAVYVCATETWLYFSSSSKCIHQVKLTLKHPLENSTQNSVSDNRVGVYILGSMSIVGVRFFESRSFFAFEVILMFCSNSSVLLHGKQTFKCQSIN